MAIVFANLGASTNPDISSGTDATSYSNTSWTPPTSGLIVCDVIAKRAAALDTPTVSGNGITWVQIGSTLNCGGNNHGLSRFAANAAGSTTGATTIDFGSNTQIHCSASFYHVTGVDLSGGVAAAFVSPGIETATGIGTTGTVTRSAAASSENRPIAAFFHAANEGKTPRTNWTELDDLPGTSGVRNLQTQYRSDAFETTASATWTTSENWGGIASELKAEVETVAAVSPKDAIHAMMSLPGLRAFWPLNEFDDDGSAYDLSGHNKTLIRSGTVLTYKVNQKGAVYAEFDSGESLGVLDSSHFDINGTESYVASGKKGLTFGGWFRFASFSGSAKSYSKGSGANRSYEIGSVSAGSAQFECAVSNDGTAVKQAQMTGTLALDQWYFLVGRFTPSTEVAFFVSKTKFTNTTSIPASLFNTTVNIRIGEANQQPAYCFLCAMALSDAELDDLYDATAPLFETGPSVTDTITLTEAVGRNLVSLVNQNQAVTLTEAQTVSMARRLSQNETVTLTEAATASMLRSVSTGETVTLTETVSRILASLVSKNETVTVSESSTAVLLVSLVAQGETITLAEGVSVRTTLNISVGETVTLTESTLISAGGTALLISLAETITLTESASVATVTFATIVVYDTLGITDATLSPIFSIADTLTMTDSLVRPVITDTLTMTDTVTIGNVTVIVTDTLTFSEVLVLDGPTVTPPATPATGGLDTEGIVLKLHYGNDRRNPIRTLDIAQLAPGEIRLMAGGFAAGAGERTQLWSGESIRFDGQDLLAESRKNSQLSVTYALKTGTAGAGIGSHAALSYFQRQINRFFTEAKVHQTRANQNHTVWLEYRWPDGLTSLPTPTFGQLSTYYEVYSATTPKWPDTLHDDLMSLNQGLIAGVVMEITGSPTPMGLKQRAATAGGAVSLHDKGVLIASGSSSRLHWSGYTGSGLLGQFHITGWVTLNAAWGSGTKYVFDYYVSASNRISVVYDASNTRWTITKIVSGNTFTANSSSDTVSNGDDIHLQLVQDATTLYLYVNGTLAASVTATATMTDGGLIALGCPATGTIDGIDGILDGWRIMPVVSPATAPTSTQVLALYEAELPIKEDGGKVGPPPFFWTKDSDATVDNCDDASRDNWGIVGGVGGDLEAETEIRLQLPVDFSSRIYYLGIRSQDSSFTPSDYIFIEPTSNTTAADGTASGGTYSHATSTSMDFYADGAQADPALVLGQYRMLARIFMPTTPVVTLTPKFAFTDNVLGLISGRAISYTGSGSWRLVDIGDLFITTDSKALLEDDILWQPMLTASASSSFTGRCDFIHLLPWPYARIQAEAAIPAGASHFYIVIEDGLAFVTADLSYNTQEMNLEYRGAPLRATPDKYNYLFMLQAEFAGDLTVSRSTPITVYVTPRYLLPGGMVA